MGLDPMIPAILLLIACELVGEIVREALGLPIPGPVIGMFLLAAVLSLRKDRPERPAVPWRSATRPRP